MSRFLALTDRTANIRTRMSARAAGPLPIDTNSLRASSMYCTHSRKEMWDTLHDVNSVRATSQRIPQKSSPRKPLAQPPLDILLPILHNTEFHTHKPSSGALFEQ